MSGPIAVASKLPDGDGNGLGVIYGTLVRRPHKCHAVIAIVDCSKVTTNSDTGEVKPTARLYPAGKPDLSKLLRSTEDALTDAGLWRDDAQVVAYSRLEKVYAGHYPQIPAAGAMITITQLAGSAGDRP